MYVHHQHSLPKAERDITLSTFVPQDIRDRQPTCSYCLSSGMAKLQTGEMQVCVLCRESVRILVAICVLYYIYIVCTRFNRTMGPLDCPNGTVFICNSLSLIRSNFYAHIIL
jgi:hypothetical protein